MKQVIFGVVALIIIGGLVYYITQQGQDAPAETPEDTSDVMPVEPDEGIGDGAEPLPEVESEESMFTGSIGESEDGREIRAEQFGDGDTEILFVGGIHGGYSWNTALVAYELIDYLEENPEVVPDDVTVTVVPVLNPDGLFETTGKSGRFTPADVPSSESERVAGRFNANGVDLNRNFDCEWESTGTWQDREVSGGSAPFSEPESQAMRDYILENEPAAVVVWYSAAGGVFSSSCNNGVAADTEMLTNLYADAAGYQAYEEFDFYEITGDMVNWVASQDIPGISVLLTDHQNTEWTKNQAGIEAILNYYAQ